MKSEKGITLVTLVITLIVFIILVTTISVNMGTYRSEYLRSSLESDIQALREEVELYYAAKKELPVINRYTNLTMIDNVKNLNDNDVYYIIDIRKLDVDLRYGQDFYKALARERNEEINDLLDIYIINEQSHSIYYPKGIDYNGTIFYTVFDVYSDVQGKINDEIPPTVNISLQKSKNKLFGIEATITISDAFSRN